jgi:hypothetical protein
VDTTRERLGMAADVKVDGKQVVAALEREYFQ